MARRRTTTRRRRARGRCLDDVAGREHGRRRAAIGYRRDERRENTGRHRLGDEHETGRGGTTVLKRKDEHGDPHRVLRKGEEGVRRRDAQQRPAADNDPDCRSAGSHARSVAVA